GVVPAGGFPQAHDHSLDCLPRLDIAAGDRLFDAGNDDVAQAGITAARSPEHLDAHAFLGTGVVGNIQVRIHLNHYKPSTFTIWRLLRLPVFRLRAALVPGPWLRSAPAASSSSC